jgi:hypothetical protein
MPLISNAKQNIDVINNCENINIPMGQELDIMSDSDSGTITIGYINEVGQEQVTYFNFNQNTSKCNDRNKDIINSIKQDHENFENDICKEIREVVAGKRKMPTRDGYTPTNDDAKKYIKAQCKGRAVEAGLIDGE